MEGNKKWTRMKIKDVLGNLYLLKAVQAGNYRWPPLKEKKKKK